MRPKQRLKLRMRPLTGVRLVNAMGVSIALISALVINLFVFTYLYFNLGTPKTANATIMSAVASGNWTSASTWSSGRVPQDGDTLTIPVGKTVYVDIVTPSYNHLLIIVNGTLYFNGGKKIIMCEGMVVVSSGGLLSAANTGSKFEICGSFLWDGSDPGAGPLVFGGFSTALPVELAYFKAIPESNGVNLQWETASQTNCDYFLIERSADGSDFSSIEKIKGKGNSNQKDVYNCTDKNPFSGSSYYRLTEVDFNGTMQAFNTVSVTMKPSQDITVYPNPVSAGSTATIEIPGTNDNEIEVSVLNIEGKKIFSKTFTKSSNGRPIVLQTDAFSDKGTFLLVVSGTANKIVRKILVV